MSSLDIACASLIGPGNRGALSGATAHSSRASDPCLGILRLAQPFGIARLGNRCHKGCRDNAPLPAHPQAVSLSSRSARGDCRYARIHSACSGSSSTNVDSGRPPLVTASSRFSRAAAHRPQRAPDQSLVTAYEARVPIGHPTIDIHVREYEKVSASEAPEPG
jgi:hypothetical protein